MCMKLFQIFALSISFLYTGCSKNDNSNNANDGRDGVPTVKTTAVTNLAVVYDRNNDASYTANVGGNITNDGGSTPSTRGVVWSTKPNPTLNDNKITDGNGEGIGSFTLSVSFHPNTTYYYRAFAMNYYGIGYGNELSITTPSAPILTWKLATVNWESKTTVYGFAAYDTTIFAATNNNLSKSNDKGLSWSIPSGINGVAHQKCIYVYNNTIYLGSSNGILISTDGGRSWNSSLSISSVNDVGDVNAILKVGDNLFVGTQGGIYVSKNNGGPLTLSNTGLPSSLVAYCFTIVGTKIYAGTNQGVFVSTNNGASWGTFDNGLPTTNNFGLSILADGGNLYLGHYYGVYYLPSGASTWQSISSSFPSSRVITYSLAKNGSTLYVGTSNGVYSTSNNGGSWNSDQSGLPTNDGYYSIGAFSLFIINNRLILGSQRGIYYRTI